MITVRRVGVLLASTLLVLAGGALLPATSASAAWHAPCTYGGCQGLDPHSSGCDSDPKVSTITYVHPDGPWDDAQLRYSPGCHAFWVRVFGYPYAPGSTSGACNGGPGYQYGRLRTQAYESTGGWQTNASYRKDTYQGSCPSGDVTVWTKMSRSGTGYRAQVCRTESAVNSDGACTSWYTKS